MQPTANGKAGPRVAVVGAGFAGLAAARRLARQGFAVDVFERSGTLGGLAMTIPFGDTEIEKYYHHWFTSDEDVIRLVEEIGLGDRVRWISPVMGIFCAGRVWRFTSPADLLRFEPLGLAAKLRFGLVTLFLQRWPHRQTFEGVGAAEWLRRFAGREVFDVVWGPLLRAKFGRLAEEISMAWIWSKMRLRGRSRTQGGTKEALGYLDGGFGVVSERLAAEIAAAGGAVHAPEAVRAIEPEAGALAVATAQRRERYDAVLSTVAPALLARLAPALPAAHRGLCESIEHAGVVCTLLSLRRSISPIYWLNVSDAAVPFGGLIEHTNFIPPEVYGGRHLAYLSHYVYPDDPVWRMEGDELFAHYLPGLRRIRPDFDESWVERRLPFRDRYAQPIVGRDYHRRLLPIETPLAGLFATSLAQVYPEDRGTNYAVRLGHQAADAIGAYLARRGAGLPPRGDREHPLPRSAEPASRLSAPR